MAQTKDDPFAKYVVEDGSSPTPLPTGGSDPFSQFVAPASSPVPVSEPQASEPGPDMLKRFLEDVRSVEQEFGLPQGSLDMYAAFSSNPAGSAVDSVLANLPLKAYRFALENKYPNGGKAADAVQALVDRYKPLWQGITDFGASLLPGLGAASLASKAARGAAGAARNLPTLAGGVTGALQGLGGSSQGNEVDDALLGLGLGLGTGALGTRAAHASPDGIRELAGERMGKAMTGGNIRNMRTVKSKFGGKDGDEALARFGNEAYDLGLVRAFDNAENIADRADERLLEVGPKLGAIVQDAMDRGAPTVDSKLMYDALQSRVQNLNRTSGGRTIAKSLNPFLENIQEAYSVPVRPRPGQGPMQSRVTAESINPLALKHAADEALPASPLPSRPLNPEVIEGDRAWRPLTLEEMWQERQSLDDLTKRMQPSLDKPLHYPELMGHRADVEELIAGQLGKVDETLPKRWSDTKHEYKVAATASELARDEAERRTGRRLLSPSTIATGGVGALGTMSSGGGGPAAAATGAATGAANQFLLERGNSAAGVGLRKLADFVQRNPNVLPMLPEGIRNFVQQYVLNP